MSELGFYRFANSHPDEIAIVEPSEKIWKPNIQFMDHMVFGNFHECFRRNQVER